MDGGVMKRKYVLDEEAFLVPSEERSYWVGFIITDGNIDPPRNKSGHKIGRRLRIALHRDDKEHLKKLRRFLMTNTPIRDSINNFGSPYSMLEVCSNKIVESLELFGVTPRKSMTVKAPVLFVNDRHFWRGVIDGDGSIWKIETRWKPSWGVSLVGTHRLVSQFKEYLTSRGIETSSKIRKNKSIWEFRVGGSYLPKKVLILLYQKSKNSLNRKRRIYEEMIREVM